MNAAREFHTATLLPNTDVNHKALSSTELYDPRTGTWSSCHGCTARDSHRYALNGPV